MHVQYNHMQYMTIELSQNKTNKTSDSWVLAFKDGYHLANHCISYIFIFEYCHWYNNHYWYHPTSGLMQMLHFDWVRY